MVTKKTRADLLAAYENDGFTSGTQFYGYIKVQGNGEFRLDTYAISVTKTYGVQMTEVNRAWSDKPTYRCKNVWKNIWGMTMIEFDEKRGRPGQEGQWYNGKWGRAVHWKNGDSWYMPTVHLRNPEALKETKYRYCGYEGYRGGLSLMAYVRLYKEHKEVEFLSRAGLHRFIDASFLKRMAANKALRDFFRSNVRRILAAKDCFSPTDVIRARANGWSLEKAHEIEYARHKYHWAPKGIDRVQLHRYLRKNGIAPWDYRHYVDFVEQAKMDINGFGMAFPKDFDKAVIDMQKRIARAKAKEERLREAALMELATRINTLIEKMRNRLAWRVGDYSVVVPQKRRDFVREGKAMHNCIGGYFEMCADGDSACFFIRKNGKRLADVEMSAKDGSVRQCRLVCNGPADDETMNFAKLVAKKILPAVRMKKAA